MSIASAIVAVLVLFPRGCGHHARFAPTALDGPHAGKSRTTAGVNAGTDARARTRLNENRLRKKSQRTKRVAVRRRKKVVSPFSSDRIAPEISLQLLSAARNHQGEYGPGLRVRLTGTDKGSGLRGLYWRRGSNDAWRRYGTPISPYGRERILLGRLEFQARDRAGNVSRTMTFAFRIDDVPPAMPFIYVGRRGTRGGNLPPADGILIPTLEPRARMHYRLGNGPYRECTPGTRIKITGEGDHRLTFRVSDEVGNARTSTHKIQLDNTPPRTTIKVD